MKFDRKALLAACERAIEAHTIEAREEDEKRVAKYEELRAEWLEVQGPKWVEFFKEARVKLRRKEPITADDMPRTGAGYSNIAYYSDNPPKVRKRPYVSPELATLAEVLRAITEDEVSQSGLIALGITRTALRGAVTSLHVEAEA